MPESVEKAIELAGNAAGLYLYISLGFLGLYILGWIAFVVCIGISEHRTKRRYRRDGKR